MLIKAPRNLSSKEEQEIRRVGQQPLEGDGYSNNEFDRLYGHKTKNPFHYTERDRRNKTFGRKFKSYTKAKGEYETYRKEMSPSEQFKYEKFLRGESKKWR